MRNENNGFVCLADKILQPSHCPVQVTRGSSKEVGDQDWQAQAFLAAEV